MKDLDRFLCGKHRNQNGRTKTEPHTVMPSEKRSRAVGSAGRFWLTFAALILASPFAGAQTLLGTVPTGVLPTQADVNTTTNKIYVANRNSNSVTVIDGSTNAASTVRVGSGPQAVAVDSALNKTYAANANSNTVTVIDGATNGTTTLGVGNYPVAVAANAVTNKIYVSNYYGGSVTVINGTTNSTATVTVGSNPAALAINPQTNKIYVANIGSNSVTVIDGATNFTSTVPVGSYPEALAIDQQTNQIYVANYGGNTVTVMDGSSLTTTTINVGLEPSAVAVNSTTNQIYVANKQSGTVSIIDGATLAVNTVTVGSNPNAVVVDSAANKAYLTNFVWNGTLTVLDGNSGLTSSLNVGTYPASLVANWSSSRIYVPNSADNTVSVIALAPSDALLFVPVVPCRVMDTRLPNGPFGGPAIGGGGYRNFAVPQSACSIPATAAAYSLNVTVVPHGPLYVLEVWPTGEPQPTSSTVNSYDGRIKATASIVPAGASGAVSVWASNTANVVLDIDGYFVRAPAPSALAFYPLQPCRVADTRWPTGALGGPYLHPSTTRELPVRNALACNIPSGALAYSVNFTAIPRAGALWVLSTWPAGEAQPLVSTLNAPTGTTTANAAIVPAGNNGDIDVWASDATDLVIDINGYFATSGPDGLSLYSMAPCRALDTRETIGVFSGLLLADIASGPCGVSSAAQAYVLNATVVPNGPLWVLTLWPNGQPQPSASTLNAYDGMVTSNMAIVPTANGSIDAYTYGWTALVLDISSYFAP